MGPNSLRRDGAGGRIRRISGRPRRGRLDRPRAGARRGRDAGALLDGGQGDRLRHQQPGKPGAAYAERLRGLGVAVADERVVTAGDRRPRGWRPSAVGPGGSAFVIGARGAQGRGRRRRAGAARRRGGARGRRGRRLRPPRLRLRRAADRDAGAAARRGAVRDQPRPDPADAGRRLAGDRRGPRRGRDRLAARAPRSAASPSATCSSWPATPLILDRARTAELERVAMVGDRIASDIEGGRRAGLATILVLSGATSREEAEGADPPPDHVVDDLAGAAAVSAAAEAARPAVAPPRRRLRRRLRRHLLRPARGRRGAAGAAALRARPARRRQRRGRRRDRLLRGHRPAAAPLRRPPRRPPRAQADGPARLASSSRSAASSTCCRSGCPG